MSTDSKWRPAARIFWFSRALLSGILSLVVKWCHLGARTVMRNAWPLSSAGDRDSISTFELMPQYQDFGFQPPPRLEAVAQHADEKEGNCNHATIML
jgi:hypothetical protein